MGKKYITIPFDVERAKRISNGEEEGKIVTRDGKEVRIVCFNARHNNYPIIGLIDEGDYESAESFSKNGSYSIEDGELDCDLFLKVPDYKNEFKPFDRVLVRDYENKNWMPRFFEKYSNSKDYHFRCMNGSSWKYCIPYEGNEHLLGTSNDPD